MEKDVTLTLHLSEDEVETIAHAVLNLRGDHFEALGRAKRRSGDPSMPVVGEELAIARALSDITADVMGSAQTKIEEFLVH